MRNIVNRSICDVVCAMLPLTTIGIEVELEKEFNERFEQVSCKTFGMFRDLLWAFQGTCSLFAKDEKLELAISGVHGGSEVINYRETVRQRLLKITELLDHDGKLDENTIKLRIIEVHRIISELRGESFPRLLDQLKVVKKIVEDEARS